MATLFNMRQVLC